MKGSLAAMIGAMAMLATSNERFAGDVLFTGVVDEEYMSIGTSELIKRFRADAAVVGEPTKMNIGIATKDTRGLRLKQLANPPTDQCLRKVSMPSKRWLGLSISFIQLAGNTT